MFDVISVGSATVDVFIRSKSRQIELMKKKEEICFPVGSKILIDYLRMDTGGSGTNSSVAFSRLGLKAAWIGRIGTDMNSRHVLDQLKEEKVKFLGSVEKGGSTGYSVILIGIEKDRTILAYKGINDELKKSDVNFSKLNTKWFYMGSMLGRSFRTAEKIAGFAKNKNVKLAFNPSMYVAKRGFKKLKKIIDACHLLVLNKQEAKAISGSKSSDVDVLLKKLQQKVPLVVITEGKKGAYAYNGIEKYTLRIGKQKVVETTGAGDSFASGFLAGIIMGFDIEKSLRLGYAEAVSVLGHIGAKEELLSRKQALKKIKSKGLCKIIIKKFR